ncbi:MAG: hypothetical protein CM15mP130_0290 [Verrucomicrobiota bacterium]|nr:MAG: hypothetical protein CM15mP130_0290 [Verrucomicrobiota bacterium]
MNTGSRLGGDPSIGAWANYGLGSVNQNLPGYVVMTELALPRGGSEIGPMAFFPGNTRNKTSSDGSPILDLRACS